MSYLKERILKDGQVFENNVLKVDSFLNHQIDPQLMIEIVKEFQQYFKDKKITKVLTVEASGIAPAILVAEAFKVPMLFAKKMEPSTMQKSTRYETIVHSYTKNISTKIIVSKEYLSQEDNVLIIDDFLANGQAAKGLIDIVNQAGAGVAGVGICIEKSFQEGRQLLEDMGIDVYSICRIASLENNHITFVE